ncbi:MepB family protein [Niabella pedocola]|uniref:MepB family protein n=1 Tax=Niabella pedocola TaxID=1752077 RepID=UPI00374DCEBC
MDQVLNDIEQWLLKTGGLHIAVLTEDPECRAYSGCSFQIENRSVIFRKAKRTPKKEGHFVTLWKRDPEGQTQPLNLAGAVDFFMIATAWQNRSGFFFFPKSILGAKKILTVGNKEGKRGFRIYTNWDLCLNQQAEKTKAWQANYFIDLTEIKNTNHSKLNSIINQY